jgi:hypothetical protein
MNAYLAEEFAWRGVRLSGRIRRSRKPSHQLTWEGQETRLWVSSLPDQRRIAHRINQALRDYWTIENGVFRVRDVSYNEDRLHGRKIARSLSTLRNVAINLIRQEGYPYIPDGWRDIACKPDHGLYLLQRPRLKL